MKDSLNKNNNGIHSGGMLGGAYFLTIIGAAVYFIHHAELKELSLNSGACVSQDFLGVECIK